MRLQEDPSLTDEKVIAEWYNLMVSALGSLEDVSNHNMLVMDLTMDLFLIIGVMMLLLMELP